MKRFLLILLIVSVLFFAVAPVGVSSAEALPYEYAAAFASLYPTRTLSGDLEQASSAVLVSFLEALGYRVETPTFVHQIESTNTSAKITCHYNHVLGFKDNGKGKTVLIGTYYGCFEPSGGDGVGEGAEAALSVGVLQYVAAALSTLSCDYDIVIAFWGGVALSDFNVEKCGVDLDTLALYINLDGVAAGSYDYLYCDDVKRAHATYFKGVIEEAKADILDPPAYKRAVTYTFSDGTYLQAHLGILGANHAFLAEDIPCASFVGGAWTYKTGVYRYEGKGDVVGTSEDTFETIDRRNGGKAETEKRLLAVSNVIIKGVTGEGLSAALEKAEKEVSGADLQSPLAYYLILFIGAAVVILLFVLLIVRQGKDRRERVWEDAFRAPEEDAPDEDSPFEEFEGEKKQDPPKADDEDDVFRF
ncbi:MAG: hypothetical protein J6Y74_02945 [Clostridia bacterium]|nr:hypothetical protein [Clostridia bacterium]